MAKQNNLILLGILVIVLTIPLVFAALPPWEFEEPCLKSGGEWNSENYKCTCPSGTNLWSNGFCYIKDPEESCVEIGGEVINKLTLPEYEGWAGPQWGWFMCQKNGNDITSEAYENAIISESGTEVQECLFTINDYCIKLWMILSIIGGIILLRILKK